jgi:hypothetical protein
MVKYVIATKTYNRLKPIEKLIEQWKKEGTLKKGTSIFEVKKKAVIKNIE